MKYIFTIFLILTSFCYSRGQQIAQHNMYLYNLTYINPAATGYSKCKCFNITDKHQWTGIKGAPSIQLLSGQITKETSKTKKHGFGLNLTRDINGASKKFGADISWGFHITFGRIRENHLSFGLSGNVSQFLFDETDFTEYLTDPIISRGYEQELSFNTSTGIFIYNEKYFTGIAVFNLLPVNTELYQDYGNEQFFPTAILGININPRKYDFLLKSSVYGCKGNNFFQFDINNQLFFKNDIWAGLTLRKYFGDFLNAGQNAILFFGYEFNKWNLSYAYDIGINKLQANHVGSHQFNIAYKICRNKYACPTYAH